MSRLNYVRQSAILNLEQKANNPITIIGAGALGSWTTIALAKLGFSNIILYDFDSVENHNIPNQFFSLSDLGKSKVDALYESVKNYADIEIVPVNERFEFQSLIGIVIILVDSMTQRKIIYELAEQSQQVDIVIEARMDVSSGMIFTSRKEEIQDLLNGEFFYTDEEADKTRVCTAISCCPTAMAIASHVAWQVIKFVNGARLPSRIIFSFDQNSWTFFSNVEVLQSEVL